MSSLVAGLVLAAYQFVGLDQGPGQQHLQKILTRTNSQPALELAVTVTPSERPIKNSTSEKLSLQAASSYAVDAETFMPLHSTGSDKQLPIASITKITSALVVLKHYLPDQIVTIPTLPLYQPNDSLLKVTPGEQFRFDQLLAAALIPSANDASDSLAIASTGTTTAFSQAMNRLMEEWGIGSVHYTNPSGLSDDNNYATAQSLAKIAKLATASPLFNQLTSTKQTTIANIAGKTYNLSSTNELLGSDPRISGLKTGFTAAAGQCFVGLATIKGHKVITVVLNSPDRFGETKQMLDWIERNWSWE